MQDVQGPSRQIERTLRFAVPILVLFQSMAMHLGRPSVHKQEGSASILAPPSFTAGPSIPLSKSTSTLRTSLLQGYRTRSLAFEVNRGQSDPRVRFLARGAGYSLFFTPEEVVVALNLAAGGPAQSSHKPDTGLATKTPTQLVRSNLESPIPDPPSQVQRSAVIRMRFLGSTRAPRITGSVELPGKVNYFIGNAPGQWRSNIATYSSVRYADIYPGVSVVYYGTQGRLEYDLVIQPGVDPKVIALQFEGTTRLGIDAQGNLRLGTADGDLILGRPRIYQMAGGGSVRRKNILGGYALRGGGRVGFQVGDYDRGQPLIVDPVLSYSTYLGGTGYDAGTAIAVDASGNAYVTGFTRSPNFPTTAGSFQTICGTSGTCNGYFWDAFVTKLTPNGLMAYSTFLGGSGNDMGKAIAVDASGAAYVAGQTFSSNFPTTAGAFQTAYRGSGDAFVAKVSPAGTSLQYSTYLGGSRTDNAEGIAVDVLGNAFVTGQTYSDDFPTAAAIQSVNGGNQDADAFVTEINGGGSALVYSTYLGGSNADWGEAIAVDPAGNAVVTGATKSSDFPLASAFQPVCMGCPGFADAFVVKIAPRGAALVWGSYLGGSGSDCGSGIAIDATGDIYVTGFSYSADFPITPQAYQPSLGPGGAAVFVSKIRSDFSALVYSTYLHGNGLDFGKTIAVDTGNVFVAGQTYSTSFPLANPVQSTCNSSGCFFGTGFVSEFSSSGSRLVFSTYFGGSRIDQVAGIALDPSANVYLTGEAGSSNLPTANAFQATFGGSYADAFATKITLAPAASLSPTSLTFGGQQVGKTSGSQAILLASAGTAPLHIVSVATSGDFAQTNDCGTGVAAGSTCTINVTFTPSSSGTRTGTLVVTDNASSSPQTATLAGNAGGPTITTQPSSQTVTLGQTATFSVTATGTPPLSYQWQKNNTNISQATASTYTTPATIPGDNGSQLSVVVSDSVGSVTSNAATLTVNSPPSIVTQPASQTVTAGQTATFNVAVTGTTPFSYQWLRNGANIPGATASTFTTAPVTISDSGALFSVTVSNLAGSVSSNAATLTIGSAPATPALNPASLTFTSQFVGANSPPQAVTLSNNDVSSLSITGISVTGANSVDFKQNNTCGTSLAPGGQCTISVVFSPTAGGTRTAAVSIADNASTSPQSISLSGIGAVSSCSKFVSPSGSDSNSGTLTSPWQHLQKAFNGSAAGDVACLRGGTYPSQNTTTYSQVMNNSGAAGNPITIQNFPGEVAVVQGKHPHQRRVHHPQGYRQHAALWACTPDWYLGPSDQWHGRAKYPRRDAGPCGSHTI
jgi:Beta-propeller repeat/Immunoglobulin domain/Abnormal spindle-like microcephaly-assoc'd, ASPM-SPD-2-Hydin